VRLQRAQRRGALPLHDVAGVHARGPDGEGELDGQLVAHRGLALDGASHQSCTSRSPEG
jgi:hypothetical protein